MNRSAGVELREAAARESGAIQGELRYVQDALSRTISTETRRSESDTPGVVAALRAFSDAALQLAKELENATLVGSEVGESCGNYAVIAVGRAVSSLRS